MINVDGVLARGERAVVPVLDRGFLYGDSVYEVFRTYRGVGFLRDEHLERLERSAGFIRLHISQSRVLLIEQVRRTIAGGGFGGEEVYVRIIITRGAGPINLLPDAGITSRCVIIVKPLPRWPRRFYAEGVRLAVPPVRRNSIAALDPNIKGGNYLNNVLGILQARERDADDCVMLNHDGQVAESSTGNIWFVMDGVVHSPGPDSGNLRGLTREALLAALEQQGVPCDRGPLEAAALDAATECFMTSSTREVMPVRRLALEDGAVIEFPPGGGERTRHAMDVFAECVRQYVAAHHEQALW